MSNRPFALIGVNSDGDLDTVHTKNAAENITWRSFWNGEKGTQGPISQLWNVSGWPTLYLIDHEGVIRQKWVGSPNSELLDSEIEKLVKAAEAS